MKSCPRCGREYPDSEVFCEEDGTALVAGGSRRSTTSMPAGDPSSEQGSIECPVCGGRAQPGEVICNFCGARLAPESPARPQPPLQSTATTGAMRKSAPPPRNTGPREFGDEPTSYSPDPDQRPARRWSTILGFSIAALVALAAGAWLALYLSRQHPSQRVAQASPSPSAALAPTVELAKGMPVQVQGGLSGSLARDPSSLDQVFESNKPSLTTVYKNALSTDSSMRDGMVVRLHVLPDGSIDNGAVRVSTAGNPSFDAEVIEAMTSWKFAPATGSAVTVDYPVIFAPAAGDATAVESELNTKLASLTSDEAPEYAFAPSVPSPTPAVAASSPPMMNPSPAAAPSEIAGIPAVPPAVVPSAAATPSEFTPAPSRRHHRPRREMAAVPPPTPPLIERVERELHANHRLRRVQCYTNGSVVTIFGKVFDQSDRQLAERIVRDIPGVSAVINNVTTDTQQWAQYEATISQALQNAGLTQVNVKVIGHDAYLSGTVKNELDRERAVTIAQAAAPVKVRENLITVAAGSMFGF